MQGGAPPPAADQAQFEADKRAVYKHPLFPLLALLLERCEQATAGAEPAPADAFGADLRAFVQHARDRAGLLLDEPEIDGLMIKSIQVLRIHLLELEKVQELCRDFCGRYIACLKTKMQSENLLRTDYSAGGVESNNNLSGSLDDHSSTSNSPQYQAPAGAAFPAFPHAELPFAPALHREHTPAPVVGSTPISQIGVSLLPTDSFTAPVPHGGGEAVAGGADPPHAAAGQQLVHQRAPPHPAAHAGLRQDRRQERQERVLREQAVLARCALQPALHRRAPVIL